jgi:hypothetical protein
LLAHTLEHFFLHCLHATLPWVTSGKEHDVLTSQRGMLLTQRSWGLDILWNEETQAENEQTMETTLLDTPM